MPLTTGQENESIGYFPFLIEESSLTKTKLMFLCAWALGVSPLTWSQSPVCSCPPSTRREWRLRSRCWPAAWGRGCPGCRAFSHSSVCPRDSGSSSTRGVRWSPPGQQTAALGSSSPAHPVSAAPGRPSATQRMLWRCCLATQHSVKYYYGICQLYFRAVGSRLWLRVHWLFCRQGQWTHLNRHRQMLSCLVSRTQLKKNNHQLILIAHRLISDQMFY